MDFTDRFFDWMIDVFGYGTYVMLEDIVVAFGGAFIGIIIIILCLARRLKNFEELPEEYHDHFYAVRYKQGEGDKESARIMIRPPQTYAEAVDLIISLLALCLTGKHHARKRFNRAKYIIKILLVIMGILLVISWFFISHIAKI
ncbi:MAG: hypothetical protein K0S71_317 [Clostridia bacterium]|jgi:Na+(H+)/acetate symporter ActP|nr:hypothetical protein [Clostridia bacterium]